MVLITLYSRYLIIFTMLGISPEITILFFRYKIDMFNLNFTNFDTTCEVNCKKVMFINLFILTEYGCCSLFKR